jgi:hypothetical protein
MTGIWNSRFATTLAQSPLPADDSQTAYRRTPREFYRDCRGGCRYDGLCYRRNIKHCIEFDEQEPRQEHDIAFGSHGLTVLHDVYHADTSCGVVYIKLTVLKDLLIVSFKEKDE